MAEKGADAVKRILIIGCSGAGKSTLARQLGQKLGLEVIHLDAYYWQPGWVPMQREEWRREVLRLCRKERWIMDGNYGSTLALRLQYADLVIAFDLPRAVCLWSVIRRWLGNLGRTRPDMGRGCPEKIDFEFIKWIWDFKKKEWPGVLEKMTEFSGPVLMLKSRGDIADIQI